MQENRLTVLELPRAVAALVKSRWFRQGRFRHFDLLENYPTRYACQFESTENPLPYLQRLSRRKPGLTFLLEYDRRVRPRLKGLAKVHHGKITRHEIRY